MYFSRILSGFLEHLFIATYPDAFASVVLRKVSEKTRNKAVVELILLNHFFEIFPFHIP